MTSQNLNLFDALYANMNYLGQKQKVIAGNIVNANTPGYQAREIKGGPDFKAILGQTATGADGGIDAPSMIRTSGAHLNGSGRTENSHEPFRTRVQNVTYEVAPSGNSVVIEEQMIKASEVVAEHRLMSNLHEKYLNMLRSATGNAR